MQEEIYELDELAAIVILSFPQNLNDCRSLYFSWPQNEQHLEEMKKEWREKHSYMRQLPQQIIYKQLKTQHQPKSQDG